MTTPSRFTKYADARADECQWFIEEIQTMTDELTSESEITNEDIQEEERVVLAVLSVVIEDAITTGYFMGLADGRRDILGLGGKRFVSGSNVRAALRGLLEVEAVAPNNTPTDEFISRRLLEICTTPPYGPVGELRTLGNEV